MGLAQQGVTPTISPGIHEDRSLTTLRQLSWACNGILIRNDLLLRPGRRASDATLGGQPCGAY
jgi:hypothetical protein